MRKLFLTILTGLVFLCLQPVKASSHCEIPCGIYDDEARINMINEHIATIEKSMKQINELEKEKHHNSNQLTRWIMNKEYHADQLQKIVTQYFMTQRIKQGEKNYEKKLGLLHQMLVYTMKCKQTIDLNHVKKLRILIKQFNALYFERSNDK